MFPRYAARVVRTSARAGMIASGFPAPACACKTQQLWTADGGRTWHPTKGVGWQFQGRGPYLYWWAGGTLYRVTPWPGRAGVPLRSRRVARFAGGTIVAAANIPGGVAALVSNRVGGSGWDNAPRVAVVRNGRVRTIRLPSLPGTPLAQAISASWPRITVSGTTYPGRLSRDVALDRRRRPLDRVGKLALVRKLRVGSRHVPVPGTRTRPVRPCPARRGSPGEARARLWSHCRCSGADPARIRHATLSLPAASRCQAP